MSFEGGLIFMFRPCQGKVSHPRIETFPMGRWGQDSHLLTLLVMRRRHGKWV